MRGFAGNNGRSLVSIICEVVFSAMPPQIEIRSGDRDFAGAFAGLWRKLSLYFVMLFLLHR
jgi:hypothetical protein